jgi:uric acid transporter
MHTDAEHQLLSQARADDALKVGYSLDEPLGFVEALIFGLQHVLVVLPAMIAAPLVIGQLLNLELGIRNALITGAMLGSGIGTIVSAVGVGRIGSRLPIVMASLTIYIAPVVEMARATSLAAAGTAMLFGAVLLFLLSPLISKLAAVFSPVVIGTLLVVQSVSLVKIAVSVAAGVNTSYEGTSLPLILGLGSIVLIVALNIVTRGFTRAISIFTALAILYLVSVPLGVANFESVARVPWIRLPQLFPFGGLAWPEPAGLGIILVYHLSAAIYTMSVTIGLGKILNMDTSDRIRGAVAATGLGSAVAVLFGGVPLIAHNQNVGLITLTGVGSRFAVAAAGLILVAMAFVPKFGALVLIVPPFVLGGTLVLTFAMIATVGIRILAEATHDQRDMLLIATSLALSIGVSFAPPAMFMGIHPSLRLLSSDGIFVGTAAVLLFHVLLPAPPKVR